jgi:hypothetical protein
LDHGFLNTGSTGGQGQRLYFRGGGEVLPSLLTGRHVERNGTLAGRCFASAFLS